MKITKWTHRGNWNLQQKTIVIWEAVCRRCGAIANHGYDEQEAIAVAEEEGWRKGICPECYAQELGS
jgi:ribosomal protein L40E